MQCLAFIVDGNRRWAKARGLSTYEGHKKGSEVLSDSIDWVKEAGIPHVVYYVFSTENWNRSKEEVDYLMQLLEEWLDKLAKHLVEREARVRFVGQRSDLSESLRQKIDRIENESLPYGDKTTVWFAFSYGGRAEIVAAVNEAIAKGEAVTEESFAQYLWTAELPDPDLIVRTSGEERLSNFLTWRSVYSELYFIEKNWPALTKSDFDGILNEYESRERRHGR